MKSLKMIAGTAALALGLSLATPAVAAQATTTTQASQASQAIRLSIYVHHEKFSDRTSLHCKGGSKHHFVPRGSARWILKYEPRRCWVPAKYRFTWNPIGPGIYGYKAWQTRGRYVTVPWSFTAVEAWFSYEG